MSVCMDRRLECYHRSHQRYEAFCCHSLSNQVNIELAALPVMTPKIYIHTHARAHIYKQMMRTITSSSCGFLISEVNHGEMSSQ